jgi:hypothetical protein
MHFSHSIPLHSIALHSIRFHSLCSFVGRRPAHSLLSLALLTRSSHPQDTDLVGEFSPSEIEGMKASFRGFDADGNGSIDSAELKHVMLDLGEKVTDADVDELIRSVDEDGSNTIEFSEFVRVMHNLRSGKAARGASAGGGGKGLAAAQNKFAETVQTHYKTNIVKHQGAVATGGSHSYSEDEVAAFTEHINNCLVGQLPYLPLGKGELFSAVGDGLLLCKLINAAKPNSVDERVLNHPKGGRALNLYQKKENCNLYVLGFVRPARPALNTLFQSNGRVWWLGPANTRGRSLYPLCPLCSHRSLAPTTC